MYKNIFKVVVIILMVIGIISGIRITMMKYFPEIGNKGSEEKILNMVQSRSADLVEYYTYGKAFNIKGKLKNISKDNLESARMVITDGKEYEESFPLNCKIEENVLTFESNLQINSGIILDNLENGDYYIFLRLKLNNYYEPRYYALNNVSKYDTLEYYTVTKDAKNRKATISFIEKTNSNKDKVSLLKVTLEDAPLPDDVYDIVIDAGHGGKDRGENSGKYAEADIMLDYAKDLKSYLEAQGYKVKLTRDDSNTDRFNYYNMYSKGGRITTACESKAKLMISLHISNGGNTLRGLEVHAASKTNIDFATKLAKAIVDSSSLDFSNNSTFKKAEGVYQRTFTKVEIKSQASTAEKNGYDPYPIDENTTYLYTIREVGGLATGAYVDGRNKSYDKNEYYESNQGLECYELDLGYIKNDLNTLLGEKTNIVNAIGETITKEY